MAIYRSETRDTNRVIQAYYAPVPPPDETKNPAPQWRQFFESEIQAARESLDLATIRDTPAKRFPLIINYLREYPGRDIFNWIYLKDANGERPQFGRKNHGDPTYCNNGMALLHFRLYWDAIKASVENIPIPGFGATGSAFAPPPQNPQTHAEKELWTRIQYIEHVRKIGGTDRGYLPDYLRILPLTYFSHSTLEWMRAEDKEEKFKSLWENVDLPAPTDPLRFWEELNRRMISFTAKAVTQIPLPKITLAESDMTKEDLDPYHKMLNAMGSSKDKVRWMESNIAAGWNDNQKGLFIGLSKSRYSELKKEITD